MEVLLGILIFTGLVAIYWIVDSVLSKGFSAALKAAKQNILYRSEHKEGQELVRETLNFQTTAAMPVVMEVLSKYVVTAEKCSGLAGVVYETSRSEDLVTYALESCLPGVCVFIWRQRLEPKNRIIKIKI
jgi:hypothetical protein